MIVVEGFDGSGKSTLARSIGTLLNWPVHHAGGPPAVEEDIRIWMSRCWSRMMIPCVQDRITHISESVYSMLTEPSRAAITLRALNDVRNITLVYCRPPTDIMLESILTHKAKPHDTPEHIARITQSARELIAIYDAVIGAVSPHCDTLIYDRSQAKSSHRTLLHIEDKYRGKFVRKN